MTVTQSSSNTCNAKFTRSVMASSAASKAAIASASSKAPPATFGTELRTELLEELAQGREPDADDVPADMSREQPEVEQVGPRAVGGAGLRVGRRGRVGAAAVRLSVHMGLLGDEPCDHPSPSGP